MSSTSCMAKVGICVGSRADIFSKSVDGLLSAADWAGCIVKEVVSGNACWVFSKSVDGLPGLTRFTSTELGDVLDEPLVCPIFSESVDGLLGLALAVGCLLEEALLSSESMSWKAASRLFRGLGR